ncbi:MAG: alpha/beta hydrolase [Lachnospiraceae bacterium]
MKIKTEIREIEREYRIRGLDENEILCDFYGLTSWKQKRGAAIFVHGGGFVGGSKDQFLAPASYLALKKNVLGITVEYRTANKNPYPAPVLDLFSIFKWLQDNADSLNVDLEQVYVIGGSPGANIAACAMFADKEWKIQQGVPLSIFQPKNGIFLNGIYDMKEFYRRNLNEQHRVKQYLELSDSDLKNDEKFFQTSPIKKARGGLRIALLHGSMDEVVPVEQCRKMEHALRKKGSLVKTILFFEEKHGWFNDPIKMYAVIDEIERFMIKPDK